MRVLILVDAQFARHERALIERVVVGLADEGVYTQVVLPKDRQLEEAGFDLLVEPVWYADRGLALTQRIRANQVAKQILGDNESGSGQIDIVHVFGGGAWSMGKELGRILGAGVVFEVWRAGLADSVRGLHLDSNDRALFSMPERAFETGLEQAGYSDRGHLAQWGASVPTSPSQILRSDKIPSIVLMSSGRQKDASIAAFDGIADYLDINPGVMVFANLEIVERAGLFQRVVARKHEDRFTTIDRSEDRRDLLLRCDLLVYPDTLHEERTLLLDAMGTGMLVLAGNDDSIAPIKESPGVKVVDRPIRSCWTSLLESSLSDLDEARKLGMLSREYVTNNRRSPMHIASVLDAYQRLTGEPMSATAD
ncbi:MAG: hypothetical protein P1U42_02170 [Phycisphaerales bacterium]|nr:hypothetical protein [Phycisphaerales bacterium]